MYLTRVHTQGPADVYFPDFRPEDWQIAETQVVEADAKNEHATTYMVMDRINPLTS
jgi:hypothetical protein